MDQEQRLKAALADRYQIEREIGSGGMATVYLAQDLKHHRQVAVKVLDPELAQTIGAERFLREIETVANLTHPHILPLHDSGEADGFLYYVMPFVKGESLQGRLTKERQLPVEDAIQITREIAGALDYAHREGVIHRDVKPANIMFEAGHAVLADFGVAHAVAEAKEERLTRTGTSLGTPAYMSPEQATGEQDLDGRSDQYALGCVLYEMLAGHPPFAGAQAEAILRQHLTEEPPSVTQARPLVTDEVAKAINRSLAKGPADRFRTTGEMAAALALTTAPQRSGARWFSKPVAASVAVSAVVVFGVVAALVLWPMEDPSRGSTAIAQDDRPGIAVLPFDNLSPNPEHAYFADGMQEEITAKLSMIEGLSLRGRSSVMQYKENRPPIPQIGEDLNVAFVLEGSARLAGGQVRLTTQLIDARVDEHVWSDIYEVDLSADNLLETEGRIAQQVAAQIGFNLTPKERDEVARVLTDNTEAYLLYMQGKTRYISERSGGNSEEDYPSRVLFDRAIQLDPNFAPAHAFLALSLTYTTPDHQRYERARREAELALSIQPGLGEARVALGRHYLKVGQVREAIRLFQAAEEEDPNLIMAILELGMAQQGLGVFENALRTFQRAEDLDPRDRYVQRALTRIYIFAHRYDDALRAVEIREAGRTSGYEYDRAWIHLLRGEPEKAREVIDYYLGYSGGVFYNYLPALPLGVVGRCLTVEDRHVAIKDYLNWFGADAPCLTNTEWCVGRAIHAEAVGSKETARSLWDSLRVGFAEQPPRSWYEHAEAAWVYEALGEKALAIGEAEALVELNGAKSEGEVEDMFWFGPSARIFLAQILAHFNEDDRAIDILEDELPAPSWLTVHILEIDPIWDPLRSHPRFQALLEKYADDVEH